MLVQLLSEATVGDVCALASRVWRERYEPMWRLDRDRYDRYTTVTWEVGREGETGPGRTLHDRYAAGQGQRSITSEMPSDGTVM